MNLDKLDEVLTEWRSKVTLISNNLLELCELTIYKQLKGEDSLSLPKLTGVTQTRVTTTLTAIDDLWQYLQLLTEVVVCATALRKGLSRFWMPTQTVNEIEQLLFGQSIKLPTVAMPFEQRNLLSNSESQQTISPANLLAVMSRNFELAKQTMLAVDNAWSSLTSQLVACKDQTISLQKLATSLGENNLDKITVIDQEIKSLSTQIETNPLGTNSNLDKIKRLIDDLQKQLLELKKQKELVKTELQRAHSFFEELKTLNHQCNEKVSECKIKIENTNELKLPTNQILISDLGQWLETLSETFKKGNWKPLQIGLKRWFSSAENYRTSDLATLAISRTLLDSCAELQGRFSALRAKAQTYKSRGVVIDSSLTSLAEKVNSFFHSRPIPLDKVAKIIAEYERLLAKSLNT